ncbi:MAG: class I SAM-dependent methyltransferase [Eubacterium sp.]|nr:class I SAM-dependent methyltransferase [Eubacterium sp.]
MQYGDFTELAKFYGNRPGYSKAVLECLKNHVFHQVKEGKVADIGAGTGKLTENLQSLGLSGYAVEPNEAMRAEAKKNIGANQFVWSTGSAEASGLKDNCVQWVLMGSSFHWTDSAQAVKEFHRILVPGGFFTAIWNPRNIESSDLHKRIEEAVYSEVPDLKRVSSGKSVSTQEMEEKLLYGGYFKEILFMEAPHVEVMTKDRYMNTWRSVNDIQVQAGEEGFRRILEKIEQIIREYDEIEVPYLSRSWTVQSCKK